MFYCYIIQSVEEGRYYIGSSDSLKRVFEHNAGQVKSTKPHRPWKLVYYETFQTRSQAFKRGKQIKAWKKRESIERLFKN
ncbi:MAG TPA: GIY-YIG nuclease family protein [Patescibacteria group bacterium]